MPYKSKAERESANWMTLRQVSAHVRVVERVEETKARSEVLKALKDGAFDSRRLSLIRWRDEVRISGDLPNEIGPPDVPPRGLEWERVNIRWTAGRVLDPHGAAESGTWQPAWRIVWLARSKVVELWPPSQPPRTSIPDDSRADVTPFARRRTGPKTRKLQSIVDAMTSDIKAGRLTMDMLRAMPDKELFSKYGQRFDSRRTTCREARERMVTESDGNSNSVK